MNYINTVLILWFTIVNTNLFSNEPKNQESIEGIWRATIKTAGGELPFQLKFKKNKDSASYLAYAVNGEENLILDPPFFKDDSIHISIDIFDAEIIAKVSNKKMNGYWKRYVGGKKYLTSDFKATFGDMDRFKLTSRKVANQVNGKWATTFINKSGDTTISVGIFNQNGKKVQGTFLTPTGDYRYLEGVMDGDSLKLSCFDGTHLFLFKAKNKGNKLVGKFWSNINNVENWSAILDPNAKLPDVNKLTYLKPGYSKIEFAFPDLEGKIVNINDNAFENKVKIIQIMGTWCPNCMDETRYMAPWYIKNRNRGIEIIGLSYEKSIDLAISGPKIEKMKNKYDIKYPILLAGPKDGDGALKSLPMLNKVFGFPTTIVIDKKGVVRNIHTGFSGPSTGQYYTDWIQDFNLLIDKLVAEN